MPVLLAAAWAQTMPAGAQGAESSPIVFVRRDVRPVDPQTAQRRDTVDRGSTGTLVLYTATGEERVLLDATAAGAPPGAPRDVMEPDVSFDAKQITFAGYVAGESSWRIFTIAADGTGLRQVTRSDRDIDLSRHGAAADQLGDYDDVDPCFLPDGRICFVSTRYPGIAPDSRRRTTNLHVVNADGSDLHRITTERFGGDSPTVDPLSGRIVYSRWWRTGQVREELAGDEPKPIPPGSPGYGGPTGGTSLGPISPQVLLSTPEDEFPGVNHWFLASVSPDGTGLAMFSGTGLDRESTQAYKPSFLADGRALALFLPRTPFLGAPGQNGLRLYHQGAIAPERIGGPQSFPGSLVDGLPVPVPGPLPPDPAIGADGKPFNVFPVYASAAGLNPQTAVVSASFDGQNFDLYRQTLQPPSPTLEPIILSPGLSELDPVPLVARAIPPRIADKQLPHMSDEVPASPEEAISTGGKFTFSCENIFANAGMDALIASAPPVGRKLSIEFYMAPQRTGVDSADAPILLKSVEVSPSGKVEAELPAGVPLFELLRRPDGSIARGRDGQIFHVGGMNFGEAGQKATCVGCHTGHSLQEVPADATWTNLAPSARVDDHGATLGDIIFPVDPAAGRADPAIIDPIGQRIFSTATALVDRRSDALGGSWMPFEPRPTYQIDLHWGIPLQATEVRLRNLLLSTAGWVHHATVVTSLGGEEVERRTNQESTTIALDPSRTFDQLTVLLDEQSFEAGPFPALAEIEVIARVAAGSSPFLSFLRGDSNCDLAVNLTDPLSTLEALFRGGTTCCVVASDANDDGQVNLTDPIFTLSYLFRGGDPLPGPFPDCGQRAEGALSCDTESCF